MAVGGEREAFRASLHGRIWGGVWQARNWFQLARFATVGLSGYVVNLVVFAVCSGPLRLHYLAAASLAFIAAVSNNFLWNRRWTFDARKGRARRQAIRFLDRVCNPLQLHRQQGLDVRARPAAIVHRPETYGPFCGLRSVAMLRGSLPAAEGGATRILGEPCRSLAYLLIRGAPCRLALLASRAAKAPQRSRPAH
jgi:GtrA-like protein